MMENLRTFLFILAVCCTVVAIPYALVVTLSAIGEYAFGPRCRDGYVPIQMYCLPGYRP